MLTPPARRAAHAPSGRGQQPARAAVHPRPTVRPSPPRPLPPRRVIVPPSVTIPARDVLIRNMYPATAQHILAITLEPFGGILRVLMQNRLHVSFWTYVLKQLFAWNGSEKPTVFPILCVSVSRLAAVYIKRVHDRLILSRGQRD